MSNTKARGHGNHRGAQPTPGHRPTQRPGGMSTTPPNGGTHPAGQRHKRTASQPASAFFLPGPSFVSWPGDSLPVGGAENEQRKGARGEGRKRRRGGHASPMAERLTPRRKPEPEHRAGARRATRPMPGRRPTQRPGGMSTAPPRRHLPAESTGNASALRYAQDGAFFLPVP